MNFESVKRELRERIRLIGKLEKNPQKLQFLCKDFRLGELSFVHIN